jgi:hypothetical protein
MGNKQTILIGIYFMEKYIRKHNRRWKDNTKTDLQETMCEVVD